MQVPHLVSVLAWTCRYARTVTDLFDPTQSYASAQDDVFGWHWHQHSMHLHPSPGAMFISCLVLGTCVTSFVCRHQHGDPYQAPVFASAIVASAVVGHLAGASAYLVLLGYVPWALCTAMFLSTLGHAWLRWASARDALERVVVDDKIGVPP